MENDRKHLAEQLGHATTEQTAEAYEPSKLTPETVSAILRDPDSPLYPSRITVFCDDCGTEATGEFMVSAEQTGTERLEVARAYLRTKGWQCDYSGDFCPNHRANSTPQVLVEVGYERTRQDSKFGEQNHPDGTGLPVYQHSANRYRDHADRAAASGVLAWRDVLLEEVHEALAESDPEKLRTELVQVAAVAVAWVEAIDRRQATKEA
ncbi:hypothetical protein [Streptomyces sp. YIM B13518]|uniref:hypothetical protein n=1 Tax=Streptomyces sp. YIM B13518 TaxID=3366316 RepID=UPI0036A619B2